MPTSSNQPVAVSRSWITTTTDGRFEELMEEAGPGVAAAHCSRGCAFGDFDNEVDLDIVIVNLNEPPSLLRNDVTGDNRWIKFKLNGVKSNRERHRNPGGGELWGAPAGAGRVPFGQ
jgi:hypothetical protein